MTARPGAAPTTKAELLDALTVERYATVVHEWDGPHVQAAPQMVEQPAALRLVVDNAPALFELGEVA